VKDERQVYSHFSDQDHGAESRSRALYFLEPEHGAFAADLGTSRRKLKIKKTCSGNRCRSLVLGPLSYLGSYRLYQGTGKIKD